MARLDPRWWSAVAACALAGACTDRTDVNALAPEGPPEVTLVAVASEESGAYIPSLFEYSDLAATYCGIATKANEIFCPKDDQGHYVQVDPVTDGVPQGWFRIAFDELLDPDIEMLDESTDPPTGSLVGTPVTLQCGGQAVEYTGFYDPTGNHKTYVPGPAVVILLASPVATGSECEVTIGDAVVDKDGNQVPADQRGPYTWTLAPLRVLSSSPENGEGTGESSAGVEPRVPVVLEFNNAIDAGSLAGRIAVERGTITESQDDMGETVLTFTPDPVTPDVPVTYMVSASDPTLVSIRPDAGAFEEHADYRVTVGPGVADVQGGVTADDYEYAILFRTGTSNLPDGGPPGADAATPIIDAGTGAVDAGAPDAAP